MSRTSYTLANRFNFEVVFRMARIELMFLLLLVGCAVETKTTKPVSSDCLEVTCNMTDYEVWSVFEQAEDSGRCVSGDYCASVWIEDATCDYPYENCWGYNDNSCSSNDPSCSIQPICDVDGCFYINGGIEDYCNSTNVTVWTPNGELRCINGFMYELIDPIDKMVNLK